MLKRKIETYLAKWKESKDRKPLVILGSGGAFCIFFARKSFQVFSGFSLTTTSPSFMLVLPPRSMNASSSFPDWAMLANTGIGRDFLLFSGI